MERSKPMGHSPTAFSLRTSICAYESAVLMDTTKNSYKKDIGYFIGMLHGGMLSPSTQQLRPEVTPLVTNKDNARGYRVGREFFCEAEPEERRYTDERLIEQFRELVREYPHFRSKKRTWDYGIGCILGELSGPLFVDL